MENSRVKLKALWREFRANAALRLISWIGGSGMMWAVGRAAWLAIHRNPVDWLFLGSMFLLSLTLVVVALWRNSAPSVNVPLSRSEVANVHQRPVPHDRLFTPLQLEAFQLARDILQFLADYEPVPSNHFSSKSDKQDADLLGQKIDWRKKLANSYKLRFEAREKLIEQKFGEQGIFENYTAYFSGVRGFEEIIPLYAAILTTMAHRVDGVILAPGKQ